MAHQVALKNKKEEEAKMLVKEEESKWLADKAQAQKLVEDVEKND